MPGPIDDIRSVATVTSSAKTRKSEFSINNDKAPNFNSCHIGKFRDPRESCNFPLTSIPPKISDWSKKQHYAYWSQKFSIPETKEDWMKYMIQNVRKKVPIENLSNKDLTGIIKRAKAVLCKEKYPSKNIPDPDLPACYYWNTRQVSDWIDELGFPEVKKMFTANHICGKRLIEVDANALNQMGLKDINRTCEVTKRIRSLLQIPPPNALRAIIRIIPFELYLKAKAKTGLSLSFKTFCVKNGFPYDYLIETNNKCNLTGPHCFVEFKLPFTDSTRSDVGTYVNFPSDYTSSSEEDILAGCATVENITRSAPIRDQVVKEVCDKILTLVVDHEFAENMIIDISIEDIKTLPVKDDVRKVYDKAFSALGLVLDKEKAEFIASVANEIVEDVLKTKDIMQNLQLFSNYLKERMKLHPGLLKDATMAGTKFLEKVAPIATLFSLGQLELDVMIRDAPKLKHFVEDIVKKAEITVEQQRKP